SGILEDTTYIVEGDIWVEEGDSLVIEAGAEFLFNEGVEFDINGYLYAVGTETDSIKFMPSVADSTWGGIDFNDSADDSSKLGYCLITGSNQSGIDCFCSNPTISNCNIIGNSDYYYGGGISCNFSDPNISYCTISENSGGEGGGINCHISDPAISHCIIIGNYASNYGGGIMCGMNSRPNISNCTISMNSSTNNGSGICCLFSGPTVLNTIVEGNYGDYWIYFYDPFDESITFSDFYNNEYGNFTGDVPEGLGTITGVNANSDSCDQFYNIYLDPLFAEPELGDFHLQAGSPCIDAGDPESPPDPDGSIADIGAFPYDSTWVFVEKPDITLKPVEYYLHAPYPNPFNPETTLTFDLPRPGHVSLVIYDIQGREVQSLVNSQRSAGYHQLIFDGSGLSSGIYFAYLQVGSFTQSRKLLLIK
ncbi:MAG: T9SS type A sorting domain-containing protein, partial [FCB group bacterium]|nr:T9SS type A sorting domain-containing protein [FCB group bacterium]